MHREIEALNLGFFIDTEFDEHLQYFDDDVCQYARPDSDNPDPDQLNTKLASNGHAFCKATSTKCRCDEESYEDTAQCTADTVNGKDIE